jgi:hypothetical protein
VPREQIDRRDERLMRVGYPRVMNVLVEGLHVPSHRSIVLRERGGELLQGRTLGRRIVDECLQGVGERLSVGKGAFQFGAEDGLVRGREQTQVLHEPARVGGECLLVGKRGLRLGRELRQIGRPRLLQILDERLHVAREHLIVVCEGRGQEVEDRHRMSPQVSVGPTARLRRSATRFRLRSSWPSSHRAAAGKRAPMRTVRARRAAASMNVGGKCRRVRMVSGGSSRHPIVEHARLRSPYTDEPHQPIVGRRDCKNQTSEVSVAKLGRERSADRTETKSLIS